MTFEEFQNGCQLGYRNVLSKSECHPTSRFMVLDELLIEVQDGDPHEYWDGTILAILNALVASMPHKKCQLSPTNIKPSLLFSNIVGSLFF